MRTVKRNPFLAGVATILGGVLLVAGVASSAEIGSDKAAAIVVFPKLVADTSNATDTIIQLTNTSPHQVAVRCYLVNANAHCTTDGSVCSDDSTCGGGLCLPGWMERDFSFRLTARQPIVWVLSEGLSTLPLNGLTNIPGHPAVGPVDNDPTLPPDMQGQNQINVGNIPQAPENPFIGELKCVQVDVGSEQPTQGTDPDNLFGGDLKGEATVVQTGSAVGGIDARSYNAIGIQSVQDANDGNDTLVLGQEYAGCPSILILDHFFDDADDAASGPEDTVRTTLTLVPCSENFFLQNGGSTSTVAQMLVFNEFEQRFSTSRRINCFDTVGLSDIDSTKGTTGDDRSIFNVAVQGTLTGQTRIRAVDGNDPTRGDGLLALAEETHNGLRSAAFNVHMTGSRAVNDIIELAPTEGQP